MLYQSSFVTLVYSTLDSGITYSSLWGNWSLSAEIALMFCWLLWPEYQFMQIWYDDDLLHVPTCHWTHSGPLLQDLTRSNRLAVNVVRVSCYCLRHLSGRHSELQSLRPSTVTYLHRSMCVMDMPALQQVHVGTGHSENIIAYTQPAKA